MFLVHVLCPQFLWDTRSCIWKWGWDGVFCACAPPHFFLQPRSCQGGPGNIWLVHPWQQTNFVAVLLRLDKKLLTDKKIIKSLHYQDNNTSVIHKTLQKSNRIVWIQTIIYIAGAWKRWVFSSKKMCVCESKKCWNKWINVYVKQLWTSNLLLDYQSVILHNKSIALMTYAYINVSCHTKWPKGHGYH